MLTHYKAGIPYIYGASPGNVRNRNPETLQILVNAFIGTFQSRLQGSQATGIQLSVIGDLFSLQLASLREFDRLQQLHDSYGKMNCVIMFNHSLEWELSEAINNIGDCNSITVSELLAHLPTRHLSPVDLIIRTAGEKRLSGFLPLQSTYSEQFFLDALWPDFAISQLDTIIGDFHQRKRTFGR